jgi:hypothetical protein
VEIPVFINQCRLSVRLYREPNAEKTSHACSSIFTGHLLKIRAPITDSIKHLVIAAARSFFLSTKNTSITIPLKRAAPRTAKKPKP